MGISLQKSQSVSLAKEAKHGLERITLGVGWDVAKGGFFGGLFGGGGDIDLDASCITFDADKAVLEQVWFGKLTNAAGTIRHSGDNLTGEGDGDDESIAIQLDKLDPKVEYIVLTVNSFRGQTFDKVANAFARVVDNRSGQEMAKFVISDAGPHTGIILASLTRNGGQWDFKAIGERTGGRTVHDLTAPARAIL
ncbi:TerD family protein [Erythrobacter sp. BLCC-B19]|uniref:TerD family protein n=1 Tax=Erythrobacter sp. BLCC-B19 TaxID=3025315 RepID=UPI00235E6410|nr:TerD family protein [Erythrobacter sp. BLCC-B19]WDA42586.1 tellurium resistance TerZ family protein [Erythrobacter sp. BLCC-B19]